MKIHLLKSAEYDSNKFDFVFSELKKYFLIAGNNIVFHRPQFQVTYQDENHLKDKAEFLNICSDYRDRFSLSNEDFVFLLTDFECTEGFVSRADDSLTNIFIKTSGWGYLFHYPINENYPVLYEIVAWVLRSHMFVNQQELQNHAHKDPMGCIMDYCERKEDKTLKMRTGDICEKCMRILINSNINYLILGSTFNAMDSIPKGLMCKTNFIENYEARPILINFVETKPSIRFVNTHEIIKLEPAALSFYLLIFMCRKLSLNDFENEQIRDLLKAIYSQLNSYENIAITVNNWCNNPEEITRIISKINNRWIKSLGNNFASKYFIVNNNGYYTCAIEQELFDIQNIPNEITQLLPN